METAVINEVFKYLGMLVAVGGGTAAVIFGVFQSWGKHWLDNHFSKRLEEFKHEQVKEIERLKFDINKSFDRTQRLHEYEFDALPVIWTLTSDVFYRLVEIVAPLRLNDGIDRLDENTQIEIMQDEKFTKMQINFVLGKTTNLNRKHFEDNNSRYLFLKETKRLSELQDKYNEMHIYISDKRIFLNDQSCLLLDQLSTDLRKHLVEARNDHAFNKTTMSKKSFDTLNGEIKEKLNKIEAIIKQRLQSFDITAS